MIDGNLLLVIGCIFGFFMAWGVGANDVANAMGVSIGSKALTIKQAIIIAAIFEFLGAFLAGGAVTQTVGKGIVEMSYFAQHPHLFSYGMLSSLLAAGTWLLIASYFGWPVSTTHSIIGSIIGFTVAGVSFHMVVWSKVYAIVLSWIVSPVIGGIISYLLFMSIQYFIFNTQDPFRNAKRYVPYYIFFASFIVAMVTLVKGFKYIHIHLSPTESTASGLLFALVMFIAGKVVVSRVHREREQIANHNNFADVEKAFAILMAFTACAMAFAHGSNDVANAVGPLAAIANVVYAQKGDLAHHSQRWILLLGGSGIVLGLVTYGHKVIATVGEGITELTPSRGFAATLAAATTVVLASGTGIPISTTHTLVGAILGVGFARGIGAVDMKVIQAIVASWLITLPAGAILAIIFFYLFKTFFY